MSYVLDALKKADAERERERGAVPGLGTQPLPAAGSAATTPPAELRRPWLLAAALALLLALGVAGWLWWSRGSVAQPQPSVASAPPAPVPVRPAPAATAEPMHRPTNESPAGAPAVSSTEARTAAPATRIVEGPLPAPPPQAPRPAAAPAAAPANPTHSAAAAPPAPAPAGGTAAAPTLPAAARSGSAAPQAAASPAAAVTTPAAAATAVVTPEQLPPELRAVFPHIAISGAMHAPNPAQRLLFVGSQVFREGDSLGELKLERIEAHAAVFRFRGRLVRVGF